MSIAARRGLWRERLKPSVMWNTAKLCFDVSSTLCVGLCVCVCAMYTHDIYLYIHIVTHAASPKHVLACGCECSHMMFCPMCMEDDVHFTFAAVQQFGFAWATSSTLRPWMEWAASVCVVAGDRRREILHRRICCKASVLRGV